MSTVSWGNMNKVFSTCMYWSGARNIGLIFIESDSISKGKCLCNNSGWYKVITNQQSSCNYWKQVNK